MSAPRWALIAISKKRLPAEIYRQICEYAIHIDEDWTKHALLPWVVDPGCTPPPINIVSEFLHDLRMFGTLTLPLELADSHLKSFIACRLRVTKVFIDVDVFRHYAYHLQVDTIAFIRRLLFPFMSWQFTDTIGTQKSRRALEEMFNFFARRIFVSRVYFSIKMSFDDQPFVIAGVRPVEMLSRNSYIDGGTRFFDLNLI